MADTDNTNTTAPAAQAAPAGAGSPASPKLRFPRAMRPDADYLAYGADYSRLILEKTKDYLADLLAFQPPLSLEEIGTGILIDVSRIVKQRNLFLGEPESKINKNEWRIPQALAPAQIAEILLATEKIVRIAGAGLASDEEYDLLAIYSAEEGIYSTKESIFKALIRRLKGTASTKDVAETLAVLRDRVPRVTRCCERNLIAVNNGIFDYDTKTLLPFSPEYVFLGKSRVNYWQAPANPIITNADGSTWDVESWIKEISAEDAEIENLLWELMGAVIRPNVRWNKSAWFFSRSGENGKGTLCELMRNLCGEGSTASLSLKDFSKDFALEQLIGKSAIITDENDVGTYIDSASNVKAIITNDVLMINRKYKQMIPFRFWGFMVQCLNEAPAIKDKSDSFYRRQLFVPFERCFTGKANTAIKDDYIARPEVLEYALWKVLNMNYYELSEPAACREAIEGFKIENDPVREFWEEFSEEFVWDLLPWNFLYDFFHAWSIRFNRGKDIGITLFKTGLKNVIYKNPEWEDKGYSITTGSKMSVNEPLVVEYGLTKWMANGNSGPASRQGIPPYKSSHKGIIRIAPKGTAKAQADAAALAKAQIVVKKGE